MSELPTIDAMIDQSIPLLRKCIDEGWYDQDEIDTALNHLSSISRTGAFIGMVFNFGMLTLTRANCEAAESGLEE